MQKLFEVICPWMFARKSITAKKFFAAVATKTPHRYLRDGVIFYKKPFDYRDFLPKTRGTC